MERIFASDSRFFGETDAQTIQNAVNFAEENGLGEVVIPRHNARTGENIWVIDTGILLPSEITVILEGAHLRLADGVRSNIFRNRNCGTPAAKTLAGEQHDIRIIGVGRALLDGGKPTGDCEQMRRDHPGKYPPMAENLLIYFHNVRQFEIRGLQFIDTRYWAMSFYYCRWGRISDIDFEMHGTVENQDGIDLRAGCEYFTIENIHGVTGDDTIALTGLMGNARAYAVEGKEWHIHDITIHNVISSCHGCAIVRFLCEDGVQEYNITVDGVKDTGETICGSAFFTGVPRGKFVREHPRQMGEFRNIVIRNVSTYAQRGIVLAEPMQDVVLENLHFHKGCEVGFLAPDNFACKNLVIRNVVYEGGSDRSDCVFSIHPDALAQMEDFSIERVRATGETKHIFRRSVVPVEDFLYEPPTESIFCEDPPKLASSYGRYFRTAWGKEIQNRPPDNRFTGVAKEPNTWKKA